MLLLTPFLFHSKTLQFDHQKSTYTYNHQTFERINLDPQSRFLNGQSEEIVLAGDAISDTNMVCLEALKFMANAGYSYPMIGGLDSLVLGSFFITHIEEGTADIQKDKSIIKRYSIRLKRQSDWISDTLPFDIRPIINTMRKLYPAAFF